jgi:hypothetical protein
MWALERALRRLHLRARCRWRCNARGCNGKSYDLSTRVRTPYSSGLQGNPKGGTIRYTRTPSATQSTAARRGWPWLACRFPARMQMQITSSNLAVYTLARSYTTRVALFVASVVAHGRPRPRRRQRGDMRRTTCDDMYMTATTRGAFGSSQTGVSVFAVGADGLFLNKGEGQVGSPQ